MKPLTLSELRMLAAKAATHARFMEALAAAATRGDISPAEAGRRLEREIACYSLELHETSRKPTV